MRILLVEDNIVLGKQTQAYLKEKGHNIEWVEDGASAKARIDVETFETILLDLDLPSLSGLPLLKHLRQEKNVNQHTPVIILTVSHAVVDKIKGLDYGADDYVLKPYDLDEVDARIRSVYRRYVQKSSNILVRNNLELDSASRTVFLDKKPIKPSRKEFIVLEKLLNNQGRILTKEALILSLYDSDKREKIGSNVVEVYIHRLRHLLGNDLIETVRGVGYTIHKTPT